MLLEECAVPYIFYFHDLTLLCKFGPDMELLQTGVFIESCSKLHQHLKIYCLRSVKVNAKSRGNQPDSISNRQTADSFCIDLNDEKLGNVFTLLSITEYKK